MSQPHSVPDESAADGEADPRLRRLRRYYQLAQRQVWRVEDLPWDSQPVLPEKHASERWRGLWRSILTQLLQADQMAVTASAELLSLAEHPTAALYYTTMVQDEARHVEALLKVAASVGELGQRNPYLDELAAMVWEFETLEERVVGIQGFFEALVIPFFHDIRRLAHDTVLGDLCQRLAVDDGIHHGSGVAYGDFLMARASPSLRRQLGHSMERVYPVYKAFITWRPPERAWLNRLMADRDARLVEEQDQFVRRLARRWDFEIRVS